MKLENGAYTIEVVLTGGSGRASVKSPTELTVDESGMKAVIEWSSSHYDYMRVGDRDYYPVNQEGNSSFLIDVDALDTEIPVSAETLAMSEPHMIDYTLRFDASTAKPAGAASYGWVCWVIGAAAVVAGAAALLRRRMAK